MKCTGVFSGVVTGVLTGEQVYLPDILVVTWELTAGPKPFIVDALIVKE